MTARTQTVREEIANALSHGIGFLLAEASLPILVSFAARHGGAASVVSATVFSTTMMVLYLASTLYHALPPGRAKGWFNKLDHAAIFLFIAGSYTPFALGPLAGDGGFALFAVVWAVAIAGMWAKVRNRLQHPGWSTGLYVALGWLAILAVKPMLAHISTTGLALLLAGGIAYTVGAVFFMLDSRMRYAHFVWHLFVLGGSTCHFFAALFQA